MFWPNFLNPKPKPQTPGPHLLWFWRWWLLVWISLDHLPPDPPPLTAQNYALSFPLPPSISSFFLWVFSLNFGGVFERNKVMCRNSWAGATKIQRRTPRERKKENCGGRGKKYWALPLFGTQIWVWHPSGPRRVFVLLCIYRIFFVSFDEKRRRVRRRGGQSRFGQSRSQRCELPCW